MATEISGPHAPSRDLFGLCNNTFKNGQLSVRRTCAGASLGSKYLALGFKMYITRFEVKEKDNKITFNLVECAVCNGGGTANGLKAEITFEFTPKFLDTAEPGQVTDVIAQVFAPDAEATRAAAAGEGAPAAAASPADAEPVGQAQPSPAPAGPTVKMGDTPQQVIAILGNPIGVKPGGGKVIYQYKDFQVVFVGGRVAAVQ
jgi:hypothetical protein